VPSFPGNWAFSIYIVENVERNGECETPVFTGQFSAQYVSPVTTRSDQKALLRIRISIETTGEFELSIEQKLYRRFV
jgi:hypothetical protein